MNAEKRQNSPGILKRIGLTLRRDFVSVKFAKYVLNMLITYPLMLGLTYALTEYVGMYYLLSYVISLCVSIVVNFLLAMRWIFGAQGRVGNRFMRYLVILAAFTLANTLLVKALTEYAGMYYIISIVLASGSMFLLKYITYNSTVFGRMD
jgi:dolichol-phosphate mannosyltransferase